MALISMDKKDVGKACLVICIVVGAFFIGSMTRGINRSPRSASIQSHAEVEKEARVQIDKRSVRSPSLSSRASNEEDARTQTPKPDGTVYIRWGRTVCPSEASIIYKGVIGGGHSAHAGGGSNYLCLTEQPQHDKFVSGNNAFAYIYGAEFGAHPSLFSPENMHGFTNHDGACAACLSIRNNQIMIPGRKECFSGWTEEYHGVLMSSRHNDKGSKNYICVDWESEADREGYRADGGASMWPAEAQCGSLPCPPYENGKELTCVVCTR